MGISLQNKILMLDHCDKFQHPHGNYDMDMIRLELFFAKEVQYRESIPDIMRGCKLLENKGYAVNFTEKAGFEPEKQKEVLSKIRDLIPQQRGSIVTSGGSMLPLSKSKNLNLSNTPILLVYQGNKLTYVFPCRLGERYYSIGDGLDHLKNNLPETPPLEGEMEDAIIARFRQDTSKFEGGLTYVGSEIETGFGKADLIYQDKKGKIIVIEVEREASEHSLGQILKLCAGYEISHNLPRSKVRGVIVCTRVHEYINGAAKRAQVKIWKV